MKKVGSLSSALAKYKDMNASVRVGVFEDATYPDGTPVAMVVFWNEYSTRLAPPRPFFRTTVSDQKSNWIKSVKNLVQIHNDPKKVMGEMGVAMSEQIKHSIGTWTVPENSAYTERKKGFNKPLVDTGQMLRSISFEVGSEE